MPYTLRCLPYIYASYVLKCMPYMSVYYALYAQMSAVYLCLICPLLALCASAVGSILMTYIYALYVGLICMPDIYAVYV